MPSLKHTKKDLHIFSRPITVHATRSRNLLKSVWILDEMGKPPSTSSLDTGELHCRTDLKHEVVIITSINPRVCKGKLILTSTPATRFYCDSTIDLIRSFNQRNKVSNHS
ncbi:unnamed protein product [Brassica oleracea]